MAVHEYRGYTICPSAEIGSLRWHLICYFSEDTMYGERDSPQFRTLAHARKYIDALIEGQEEYAKHEVELRAKWEEEELQAQRELAEREAVALAKVEAAKWEEE